jgi:hypothetical protein
MMSPTCQDFASAKLKKEGDASQEKLKLKNKNYVTCPLRRTQKYPFKNVINLKNLVWTQLLIEHTSSECIQYFP